MFISPKVLGLLGRGSSSYFVEAGWSHFEEETRALISLDKDPNLVTFVVSPVVPVRQVRA